jgi:hypothetical protein
MGELVAAAAPFISVGSGVVGIATSLMAGAAGSQAAAMQAAQLDEERKNAATQAVVAEQERRRELSSVLATQQAVRAGRGLDLYSETFVNIQDQTRNDAADDIDAIELNALNRQRRLGLGIQQAEAQGRGAMWGGVGGALGGIGKVAEGAGKMGEKKPKPKGGEEDPDQ